MNPLDIKIYLGLGIILFVLFILVSTLPFGKKSIPPNSQLSPTISPSYFSTNSNQFKPIKPTSTIIPPISFTGVKEEELPAEIKTLSEQKQALKSRLPLTESLFSIDFSYEQDKFIVQLREPKNEAKVSFENWLKTNYPAIPLTRFIFQ